MNSTRAVFFVLCAALIALAPLPGASAFAGVSSAAAKAKTGKVWLIYFFSSDCERCEHVRTLIQALKDAYPVRVKAFDIGRKPNHLLLRKLQAIHSKGKFEVPLVMVGETILMGENDISAKLESAVRKLARSGGSPLPYLGRAPGDESASSPEAACRDCSPRARPPNVADELKRIRSFLNRWF